MLSKDRRLHFLAWLRHPVAVGNPFASGRGLCKAMAAQLDVSPDEYVVEIGAGNGAVTKSILKAGVKPEKLVIIERDHKFRDELRRKYPGVHVELGDARDTDVILKNRGISEVGAVVSSLPLLNMPHALRHDIVQACFKVLKKDGQYIQYTYGFVSPVPKRNQKEIGISGEIRKFILLNIPPARVWSYKQKESA